MRILHVVPSYLPATRYGGPIYSVHGLAKGLVELGHEVEVFTTNIDGPGLSDVPTAHPIPMDGVRIHYFQQGGLRRLFYAPSMTPALDRVTRTFDVMHLHSVFLWPTWAGARAAVRHEIPYVLSPRGMLVKELIRRRSRFVKTAWIGLIERRNIERAAAIHATSELEATDIRDFDFSIRKIMVVPNGIDQPEERTRGEASGDVADAISRGPFVLAFGRINWKKNLIELVRAIASTSDARAIIAGPPEQAYDKDLQREAAILGIVDRISILPREVLGRDKHHLLKSCRALILPSISENFGNVVLEAMTHAKPVIVSRGVGAAKLVEAHKCGFVVAPEAQAISLSISQIFSNEHEALEMGGRGRAAASTVYGWQNVARTMAGHYAELIASR